MLKMNWMMDNEGRLVTTWTELNEPVLTPSYLRERPALRAVEAERPPIRESFLVRAAARHYNLFRRFVCPRRLDPSLELPVGRRMLLSVEGAGPPSRAIAGSWGSRWRMILGFLVVTLSLAVASLLASTGGSISGVVKDVTGGVIPGATVVALNTATRVQQTTRTDVKGFYSFPVLPVGPYEIEIGFRGFKPYQREGLVLDVNSALEVDATLELGERAQTVTVTETGVHVKTSDTQMGQVITGKQTVTVPLNGRSYTDLFALQPGVTPVTTSANPNVSSGGAFGSIPVSGSLDPGNFSISGQRESANGFMLNGADVEEGISMGAAVVPNLDSIAEFRILTSNFDAEYGNYSGGLINVVTKSGTNQFHGELFEFFRNTGLDARNFFSPSRDQFNQNQFGGTFGGPIRKDKVFFFADYQGTRTTEGLDTGLIPVPSPADRNGNLADLADSLTGTVNGSYWAGLLSQKLGYSVSPGERYYSPGCTTATACVFPNAVIPQTAWSVPAQHLLQYIPEPNLGNNILTTAADAEHLQDDKGSTRLDANTRQGMLSAYYFLDNYKLNNPYPTQQGGANVPGFNALSDGRAQLLELGDTKTFGASAVNEFRFSYLRDANNLGQPQGGVGVSLASQGFAQGSLGIVPGFPKAEGIETIVMNNITFGTNPFSLLQVNNTYEWLDNFSKVTGSHTLKLGGEFHNDAVKQLPDLIANGEFEFFGSATGSDFADFLLGVPSVYSQQSSPAFHELSRYAGIYAQDSWRMRPNLTLNYGLRWDWIRPWSEKYDQTSTLIPGEESVKFPGAPSGYVFPGDSGIPSTIAPTPNDDFSPRVGLAYSPNWNSGLLRDLSGGPGKTSIRAGFGRFFTAIEGLTVAYPTGNPPYGLTYVSPEPPLFAAPFVGAQTGNVYPQQFPVNVPPYNVSDQNPDPNINWSRYTPVNGAVSYFHGNRTPYSENYFFSIERQLGKNTLFSTSYIGSQGHHLLVLLQANPGNPATCLSVSQPSEVMPGTPVCGPFGENAVYTSRSGQVINGTRQPFGNKFGSNAWFEAMGNSNYNALQVSLQHTSGPLSLMAGYTYSKSLDQSSNIGEQVYPYDYQLRDAISAFDITHNFVASYKLQLSFDKVFHYKDWLTEDWAMSGITRFSTGLPVTFFDYGDQSLIGSQNQGVNGIGSDEPTYTPGPLNLNFNPRNERAYFNTSLFSVPALGEPGTADRRFFYGPGINNFDLALLKDVRLSESKTLEIRIESFNTFNHAQFYGPAAVDGNINSQTFGRVVSAAAPRILQIAAKLNF
jgi:hypothetical protein